MAAKNTKNTAANKGAAARPPRLIDMPKWELDVMRYDERAEFMNLLLNAVALKRTDGEIVPYPQEQFFKKQLIYRNVVGYCRVGDVFTEVDGMDINLYRFPEYIIMRTGNGRPLGTRKADYAPNLNGNYILFGLPFSMSLADLVFSAADEIAETDKAIRQNRRACQTPYFMICSDPETRLSLEHAIQQQQDGTPVVIVDEKIAGDIKGIATVTPFLVDKFLQYRDAVRDRLFNKLGIMSANINKKERVQVGEVNATVGQCLDYIYMLVDNLNRQFESYGLPYKMETNGSTEELYTDIDEEENKEEEEGETV